MAEKWFAELSKAFNESGNHQITPDKLAERLGVSTTAVYKIVDRFRHKGYAIETTGDGFYCIPAEKFERQQFDRVKKPTRYQRRAGQKFVEPQEGTYCYKILTSLREAGEGGRALEDLQKVNEPNLSRASVQSVILDLRSRGLRIDFTGTRYVHRGMGVSLYQHPRGGKPVEVRGRKPYLKEHKEGRKISSDTKTGPRRDQVGTKSSKLSPQVFVITPDRFQKALEVLPDKIRKDLMDVLHKVQVYNKIVDFYIDADQKKTQILLSHMT